MHGVGLDWDVKLLKERSGLLIRCSNGWSLEIMFRGQTIESEYIRASKSS